MFAKSSYSLRTERSKSMQSLKEMNSWLKGYRKGLLSIADVSSWKTWWLLTLGVHIIAHFFAYLLMSLKDYKTTINYYKRKFKDTKIIYSNKTKSSWWIGYKTIKMFTQSKDKKEKSYLRMLFSKSYRKSVKSWCNLSWVIS